MYIPPLKPRPDESASTHDARPTDAPAKNVNAALLIAVVLVTALSLNLTINHADLASAYSAAPRSSR